MFHGVGWGRNHRYSFALLYHLNLLTRLNPFQHFGEVQTNFRDCRCFHTLPACPTQKGLSIQRRQDLLLVKIPGTRPCLCPEGVRRIKSQPHWAPSLCYLTAFVTTGRMPGIRAICYIPGVPTYHPAPSRPRIGLLAGSRGIPSLLPTPRFSPHHSVHLCSAVNPSRSRLPLCYGTNPKAEALEGWRKRDSTVVLRYCPGSTTVAAPC